MFKLESEAFNDNELIPIKYCCDGQNISPPLHWINPPDNTVSFILIMDDPDAPHGTWDHWIIYNIPKKIRELAEGLKVSILPLPAQLASNSWHHKSYGGPCPPYGEEHRYYFKLYALSSFIEYGQDISSKQNLERIIDKFLLGKAVLIGKYARKVDGAGPKENIEDAITVLRKKDVDRQIKVKAKKEITKNILGNN